jgi:hypothetical protein
MDACAPGGYLGRSKGRHGQSIRYYVQAADDLDDAVESRADCHERTLIALPALGIVTPTRTDQTVTGMSALWLYQARN